MRRRAVITEVSDHAVLRWLERAHGLDVEAIKAMLARKVVNGAEFGAAAVVVDKVRFMLRRHASDPARIVVVTVVKPEQRRGLGVDRAHDGLGPR